MNTIITLEMVAKAVAELKSDPRFARFSPELDVQLINIMKGTQGPHILAYFDVSGGDGIAFTHASANFRV